MHPQIAKKYINPICSVCGADIQREFGEKLNRWQTRKTCNPKKNSDCYLELRRQSGRRGGNKDRSTKPREYQKMKNCHICKVGFLGYPSEDCCPKHDCQYAKRQATKWGIPAQNWEEEYNRRNAIQREIDNHNPNQIRGWGRVAMFSYAGLP